MYCSRDDENRLDGVRSIEMAYLMKCTDTTPRHVDCTPASGIVSDAISTDR